MNEPSMVDGILLVDKPCLLSSNAVLQTVKRLFNANKAGHMGSLDPLATGMLPICFGEATKFAQSGLDADKCYTVTALFGSTTDTGDAQGTVIKTVENAQLSETAILKALPTFLGASLQIPPMYSALKHKGKKLYELARAGIEIERKARPITIHKFELIHHDHLHATFTVHCSKGTYIRTLIENLGASLGLGAHVTQLHRVFTAGFETQKMYRLEELQAFDSQTLTQCLLPIDHMLPYLPIAVLSEAALQTLYLGQALPSSRSETEINWQEMPQEEEAMVRLYDQQQQFHGLGTWDHNLGQLQPKRLRANHLC